MYDAIEICLNYVSSGSSEELGHLGNTWDMGYVIRYIIDVKLSSATFDLLASARV